MPGSIMKDAIGGRMNGHEHKKNELQDWEFEGEVTESFEQKELKNVYGKEIVFKGAIFKQAVLTNCYFRKCTFIRCDFTGSKIKESYLAGSTFTQCQFRYSTWEKTHVDEDFLDQCIPSEENLARDLVRSLRINYGQIGNTDAVNKAARIEVKLTGLHYYNASYSPNAYYRTWEKYSGFNRLKWMWKHFQWKCLDLLWGNGERPLNIVFSAAVVIAMAALYLSITGAMPTLSDAVEAAFLSFWGVDQHLQTVVALPLSIARFVLFGLFMAVLIKRMSRR